MPKMSLPMSANRLRSCRRKERRTLGRPDELTMGQVEKEVPAEVLPQKEGPLLGAGGAEVEALAGERAEEVVAAVGTADAGDALAPVTAEAERGGSASDKREAKLAIEKGVALLVERFEGRKALPKQHPEQPRLPWMVVRPGDRHDGRLGSRFHK